MSLRDFLPASWPLTFAQPWLLLLLLVVLLLAYLRGKSGRGAALTFSSTAALRALGKTSAARAGKFLRAIFLLNLALLAVAMARQIGRAHV